MAGVAMSSGSTPTVPLTDAVSGPPYWRSWNRPIAATTSSAMSSPSRWPTLRVCPARHPALDAGQRPRRQEGRQRQRDEAEQAGSGGRDVRIGADRRVETQPDVRQRPDEVEQVERPERQPRTEDDGRPRPGRRPSAAAIPAMRREPGAARPEHRRVDPPVLDEERGAQQDRVDGEDDELDGQDQHARPG